MFSKRLTIFINFLFLLLLIGCCFVNAQQTNPAPTQPANKIVNKDPQMPNSPIILGDAFLGETPVLYGQEINNQPTDWLKGLSFRIKNLTHKKIVYLQFDLDFPETKVGGTNQMLYRPDYGKAAAVTRSGQSITIGKGNAPLEIEPSGVFKVSIEEKYPNLVRFIESRQTISSINTVVIRCGLIYFDDGTIWGPGGGYFKYDLEHPGQQIKLEAPPLIPLQEKFH